MQYNSNADSQDVVSKVLDKSGGITINTYPLKRITRDFNAILDFYFGIAFRNDQRFSFDDINEASPPIDSQNIVSGTNRYKFGDFTEKVIRVIKIEILNSAGKGRWLQPETMNNLGLSDNVPQSGKIGRINQRTFQEMYIDAGSGTPTHYLKYGDFVYLRPKPDYSLASALLAYFNRPAVYMASTDTTAVPGVPLIHIPMLCQLTANEFKHDQKKMSLNDKLAYEAYAEGVISEYFGRRDEDIASKMTPMQENNR